MNGEFFTGKFYQTFGEELTPSLLKLSPKICRGRNTPKHHHYDTKTRQRYHKKRKVLTSITCEHKCRSHPENSSKQNPTIHQRTISLSLVTQSCPTLHDPMDCSPPGSSLSTEFSKQKYLSRQSFLFPGDLDPGIESQSPPLWADSLLFELPGKPIHHD